MRRCSASAPLDLGVVEGLQLRFSQSSVEQSRFRRSQSSPVNEDVVGIQLISNIKVETKNNNLTKYNFLLSTEVVYHYVSEYRYHVKGYLLAGQPTRKIDFLFGRVPLLTS